MRIIPKSAKIKTEFFRGFTVGDMIFCFCCLVINVLILISNIPYKFIFLFVGVVVSVILMLKLDSQRTYRFLIDILCHFAYKKRYGEVAPKLDKKTKKALKAQAKATSKADKKALKAEAKKALKASKKVEVKEDKEPEIKEPEIKEPEIKEPEIKEPEIKEPEIKEPEIKPTKPTKGEKIKKPKKPKTIYDINSVVPWTAIEDDCISYNGKYFGAVLEIPPVEFRFFSELRKSNSIDQAFASVIKGLGADFSANLVKVERPVIYNRYLAEEQDKINSLQDAYVNGLMTPQELKMRLEVSYDRIEYLKRLSTVQKTILPFYYFVIYDSDKQQLEVQVQNAMRALTAGEMKPKRLSNKEIAVFLRYSNEIDFDEQEIDTISPEDYFKFTIPKNVNFSIRNSEINHVITHQLRVVSYPMAVDDAWGANMFDIPGTKITMKMKPIDQDKAIKAIDSSLDELRSRQDATGQTSKLMEISTHIETLSELLQMLQNDNETLLQVNIYISVYDIALSKKTPSVDPPYGSALPNINWMKKAIIRQLNEQAFKTNDMMFQQFEGYVGSQVSGYDPKADDGREINATSIAAIFPFIFPILSDDKGICLGTTNGVPTFLNLFRRDSERVNSNMVVVGKSGSGKSYATKALLSNLAAENSKIFILDPENEYTDLARNLNGKVINAGNTSLGRINPFHIITNLEDDEVRELGDEKAATSSFATHLQFLEEFFRQILTDINSDAIEYLNSLITQIYYEKGIDGNTDLSVLSASDFPTFDDLYDKVLQEFQMAKSEYLRSNLRILMNHISKFASGGRNSQLWNGESTISTEENFIVFNFQSLLANRNNTIANAQMLLILKWLDNEIIKNRDYNQKHNENRKIVIVIDEAHVFIDTKYPLALDFMFQLAKRIRKYNGMQIVITQNIKDFVGNEEISRKSTAIINACQYSLIFSLAPNDMNDLCTLYEKAGGINESEQDSIINAKRGSAFVITSPTSRSGLEVEARPYIKELFSEREPNDGYYHSVDGELRFKELLIALDARKREQFGENSPKNYIDKKDKKKSVNLFNISSSIRSVNVEEIFEEIIPKKPAIKATAKSTGKNNKENSVVVDVSNESINELRAQLDEMRVQMRQIMTSPASYETYDTNDTDDTDNTDNTDDTDESNGSYDVFADWLSNAANDIISIHNEAISEEDTEVETEVETEEDDESNGSYDVFADWLSDAANDIISIHNESILGEDEEEEGEPEEANPYADVMPNPFEEAVTSPFPQIPPEMFEEDTIVKEVNEVKEVKAVKEVKEVKAVKSVVEINDISELDDIADLEDEEEDEVEEVKEVETAKKVEEVKPVKPEKPEKPTKPTKESKTSTQTQATTQTSTQTPTQTPTQTTTQTSAPNPNVKEVSLEELLADDDI